MQSGTWLVCFMYLFSQLKRGFRRQNCTSGVGEWDSPAAQLWVWSCLIASDGPKDPAGAILISVITEQPQKGWVTCSWTHSFLLGKEFADSKAPFSPIHFLLSLPGSWELSWPPDELKRPQTCTLDIGVPHVVTQKWGLGKMSESSSYRQSFPKHQPL